MPALREVIHTITMMSKIAVITFYTPNYTIGDYTSTINKAYCDHNNYDFHKFRGDLHTSATDKAPSWSKLGHLRDVITTGKYDYVMWIDADAFFCNKDMKIEQWISDAGGKDLIVGRDAGYNLSAFVDNGRTTVNSGVMIWKSCDSTMEILTTLLTDTTFSPYYIKPNWEQNAIRQCLDENVKQLKERTYIIEDTNFNNNCNDVSEYITNGGFIVHLTCFGGKYHKYNDGLKLKTVWPST